MVKSELLRDNEITIPRKTCTAVNTFLDIAFNFKRTLL